MNVLGLRSIRNEQANFFRRETLRVMRRAADGLLYSLRAHGRGALLDFYAAHSPIHSIIIPWLGFMRNTTRSWERVQLTRNYIFFLDEKRSIW